MLRPNVMLASLCLGYAVAACSNSTFTSSALQPRASEANSESKDAPDAAAAAQSLEGQIAMETGETRPFDALPHEIVPAGFGGQIVQATSSDTNTVAVNPTTGDLTGVAAGSAVVTYVFADGSTVKLVVAVTTPTTGPSTDGEPVAGEPTDSTNTEKNADGLTPDEQNIVDNLPGVEVVRVGVNFEDMGTRGDKDFNDAVLCFEGQFKVEGSQVISIREQEVVGTTSSISGCMHTMEVSIVNADGTIKSQVSFDSKAAQPVVMKFDVGSRLEVTMTATETSTKCDPNVRKDMHSAIDAIVAADVCRNTK